MSDNDNKPSLPNMIQPLFPKHSAFRFVCFKRESEEKKIGSPGKETSMYSMQYYVSLFRRDFVGQM